MGKKLFYSVWEMKTNPIVPLRFDPASVTGELVSGVDSYEDAVKFVYSDKDKNKKKTDASYE